MCVWSVSLVFCYCKLYAHNGWWECTCFFFFWSCSFLHSCFWNITGLASHFSPILDARLEIRISRRAASLCGTKTNVLSWFSKRWCQTFLWNSSRWVAFTATINSISPRIADEVLKMLLKGVCWWSGVQDADHVIVPGLSLSPTVSPHLCSLLYYKLSNKEKNDPSKLFKEKLLFRED